MTFVGMGALYEIESSNSGLFGLFTDLNEEGQTISFSIFDYLNDTFKYFSNWGTMVFLMIQFATSFGHNEGCEGMLCHYTRQE